MEKPLFSPVAGLFQDIILLTSVVLFVLGLGMLISLRIGDYLIARKRRRTLIGRVGHPYIE